MNPIEFKGQNCVYAKEQPEYQQLPAYKCNDGTIVTCWRLTWRERLKVLVTGNIWHLTLTFNQPLQPLILDVEKPDLPAPQEAEG